MLKFFFSILLLANALLFAFHKGYLEELVPSGHEPERMGKQMNTDKIRLIAAPSSAASSSSAASVPVAAVSHNKEAKETVLAQETTAKETTAKETVSAEEKKSDRQAALPACLEIGNFSNAEARRFESQLASLLPSVKASRLERTETSSHMVLISPQGDKEGAVKKAGELRALGITDYFILQDNANPDLRWGISLGVFRNEEAARAYLVQLNQKGVRSARMAEYKMPMKKLAFQLRGTDSQIKPGIDKIKLAYPNQQVKDCT